MEIITRAQAKAAGLKFYFTGKLCPRGHAASRRVANCACTECTFDERNTDAYRANQRRHQRRFRTLQPNYAASWIEQNPEYNTEYRAENAERIKQLNAERFQQLKSDPAERAKRNTATAKRRAAKLNRTPAWLTDEDHATITTLYAEAQRLTEETGIPHVVDHIIPLQGETVSGLHVPDNLQILTQSENSSKGNTFLG